MTSQPDLCERISSPTGKWTNRWIQRSWSTIEVWRPARSLSQCSLQMSFTCCFFLKTFALYVWPWACNTSKRLKMFQKFPNQRKIAKLNWKCLSKTSAWDTVFFLSVWVRCAVTFGEGHLTFGGGSCFLIGGFYRYAGSYVGDCEKLDTQKNEETYISCLVEFGRKLKQSAGCMWPLFANFTSLRLSPDGRKCREGLPQIFFTSCPENIGFTLSSRLLQPSADWCLACTQRKNFLRHISQLVEKSFDGHVNQLH